MLLLSPELCTISATSKAKQDGLRSLEEGDVDVGDGCSVGIMSMRSRHANGIELKGQFLRLQRGSLASGGGREMTAIPSSNLDREDESVGLS